MPSTVRQLTAKQLKQHLDQDASGVTLLDIREPWEYHTCHLANSTHIPMGRLWHNYQELDPRKEIVVICHHGVRSQRVCVFLEQNGFGHVLNLEGGLNAWSRDVDPALPTY